MENAVKQTGKSGEKIRRKNGPNQQQLPPSNCIKTSASSRHDGGIAFL